MFPKFSLVTFVSAVLPLSVCIPSQQVFSSQECSNFNGLDSCKSGSDISYPDQAETRRWQTPPPGHVDYHPEWQNYNSLQGYARVKYAEGTSKATVHIMTFVRDPKVKTEYQFGSGAAWTSDSSKTFFDRDSFPSDGLQVTVKLSDGSQLVLDPIFFIWQNEEIKSPHTNGGQRGAIVELFGWPYVDVAKECESHLGKAGYMGVKVSVNQDHVESYHWLQNGELNPWYLTYQPVSYKTHTRLGTRKELRTMIHTCRKHGVRLYADAVINHMSGSGNDVLFHRNQAGGTCVTWGPKNSSAQSPYFTHSWAYEMNEFTGERPGLEFPAVPYGPSDFHCERSLNSWSSGFIMNYGWLVGLTDLNTQKEYVQQRIADYMVDLISIGFSGFRIDAAKHIRPLDLAQILKRLADGLGGSFTSDFITWLEVIIGGERDLLACQDNDYNYYTYLDKMMSSAGLTKSDISKVKIWSSDYPKEMPICGSWILPPSRFAIQNDDHDQQNAGSSSRDMGDKGSVLVIERNVEKHRTFEKLLFERTDADWQIKLLLSSYSFMNNGARGYPDGKSDCSKYLGTEHGCRSVPFSPAFEIDSCGYAMQKGGQWLEGKYTRVHRDREIIMAMRKWSGLQVTGVSNSDLGIPDFCA